jgi:hypothetical protein
VLNLKDNKKIILIVEAILSVAVIFSLLIIFTLKGTYAKDTSYTDNREKLEDLVVSTALSYYYNQDYSDYEQHAMDDTQGGTYNVASFYLRDFNVSPEDVSRSNHFNTDCSAFAMTVYLYSLGYDMSEYYQYITTSYLENNIWKKISDSISNYQKAYQLYGKGFNTYYLTKVGKKISANGDNVGVEYVNNDTSNKTSIVYYYQTNIDDENNYIETQEEQEKIRENILNTLQQGDILVYRKKDTNS